MRSRVFVVAAISALAIWYVAGVSAVFGQNPPEPPARSAPAAAPAAPPLASPAAAPLPAVPSPAAQGGADPDDEALPLDVREKLSGAQLYEILHARAHAQDPPAVAIVVPVACFLMAFAIVAVGLYAGFRRDRLRHETLRLLIERGGEIPPELLGPKPKRHSDLRRGVVLTAGGIGLAIVLAATVQEHGVWTAGLIPILLGLGYLLVWRLEPESTSVNPTPSPRET